MKDLSRFFSSSNHVKITACIFPTLAFIPFSISLSLRFFSSAPFLGFYSASSPDFLLEPKEVAYLCLRVERRLMFGCMTFMGFSPEGIAAAALA
jgi:hypothetical protein